MLYANDPFLSAFSEMIDACGDYTPDPDVETLVGCLSIDQGASLGLRFRLLEIDAEIESWYSERSPCGIHLYPVPRVHCERCAK